MLKRHGFEVTRAQVEATIRAPDKVIPQAGGRVIAQRRITERHVLRVIYRHEDEDQVVITFYPGRREQYETEL